MNIRTFFAVASTVAALTIAGQVSAFGFSDLGSIAKDAGKGVTNALTTSAPLPSKDVMPMSDIEMASEFTEAVSMGVMPSFLISIQSINAAQIQLVKAFGLKGELAELEALQRSLVAGEVNGNDALDSTLGVTNRVDIKLREVMDSGVKLSTKGRKHYTKAILPYLMGVYQLTLVKDQFLGANMFSQGTAAIYLIRKGPGLIVSLSKTSYLMAAYAKSADISMPDDAETLLNKLSPLG